MGCVEFSGSLVQSGTATASVGVNANRINDWNSTNYWESNTSSCPMWVKVDMGAGNDEVWRRFRIYSGNQGGYMPKDYQWQGSNNDSDWDDLGDAVVGGTSDNYQNVDTDFENATSYRYIRLYITALHGSECRLIEIYGYTCTSDSSSSSSKSSESVSNSSSSSSSSSKSSESVSNSSSSSSSSKSSCTYYGDDLFVLGTATSDGGTNVEDINDGVFEANGWQSDGSGVPAWVKIDMGSGNGEVWRKVSIWSALHGSYMPEDYSVQGSNNDSDWDTLATVVGESTAHNTFHDTIFENDTSYRYVRIYITKFHTTACRIPELLGYICASSSSSSESESVSSSSSLSSSESVSSSSSSSESVSSSSVSVSSSSGSVSNSSSSSSSHSTCPYYGSNICVGGTASALYEDPDYQAYKAFDGLLLDLYDGLHGYYSGGGDPWPRWIQYELPAAQAAIRLRMYTRQVPGDVPDVFTLKGSDTGAFTGEEVTVLTESGHSAYSTNTWYTWDFDNATAFTYYRLIATHSQNNYSYIFIPEMELYACASSSSSSHSSESVSNSSSSSESESVSNSSSSSGSESVSNSSSSSSSESVSNSSSSSSSISESSSSSSSSDPNIVEIGGYAYATATIEGFNTNDIIEETATATLELIEDVAIERVLEESAAAEFAIEYFNWKDWLRRYGNRAVTAYYFTLTGGADGKPDIEIPISSFQLRKQSALPTYLSVVVPSGDYTTQIADRSNGDLKLEMAFKVDGSISIREQIAIVDLTEIRIDKGARRTSINLSGSRTVTYKSQLIVLNDSIYKNSSNSGVRYRFGKVDPWVNAGDLIVIANDYNYEFIAAAVVITVSANQQSMELASY